MYVKGSIQCQILDGPLLKMILDSYGEKRESTIYPVIILISVAESLVMNADRSEEGGIRAKTLTTLCAACPHLAAAVRSKAASASRLPSLVITLTLTHHQDDLVRYLITQSLLHKYDQC